MRLTRGITATSALVLTLFVLCPTAQAEDWFSPRHDPSAKPAGSIFEYFRRKREERSREVRRFLLPGPPIQNAPGIEKDLPEAPLVYQPDKLQALKADSFEEAKPQEALPAARVDQLAVPTVGAGETLESLRSESFDPDEAAARGMGFERLDQLALEHLYGVRG